MRDKNRPLQAATVNDISGFGRCSLTVSLPVLSAMGVHLSCIPTAVLSTHTGGFQGYTFRDLTQDIRPFFEHWKKEGFEFDALYTGYLGSAEQIDLVSDFLTAFQTDTNITLVDPVMGDHGKLYSLYTPEMAKGMKRLCARADVIVPNMTEGAYLTGMEFKAHGHSEEYLSEMCQRLMSLGAKNVVITGVSPAPGLVGAACHDGKKMEIYAPERVNAQYDGTGDVFASVLLGALLHEKSLLSSVKLAADFTRECIARSLKNNVNPHHGVDFEMGLWQLGKTILDEGEI
ncbi:MAG: pyridoxamine kinase [Clostridiales bacterium]|nr:pyridoxamine kinase [Clostridiales bacterium]